eukprot:g46509.t1
MLAGEAEPAAAPEDEEEQEDEAALEELNFEWDGGEMEAEELERPLYLREVLWRKYKQGLDTDVIFYVGKGEEQARISAHRLVLAASSPVMEAMLYPDPAFPQTTDDDQPLELKLLDTKPKVFEGMLEVMYTDETAVEAESVRDLVETAVEAESVRDLVEVANKYQLHKLSDLCVSWIQRELSVASFCPLFQVAPQLLGQPEFGMQFLREYTEEVLTSPQWVTLSKERVGKVLQDSALGVSEEFLFDALLTWGRHQASKSGTTLQQAVEGLVDHIRFPCMSVSAVAGVVAPAGLLTQDELLSIFHLVATTDAKARAAMPSRFIKEARQGRGMTKLEWDPAQSFTRGVYQVSQENRTVLKVAGHGSIYIIRTKQPLQRQCRSYWELYLDPVVANGPDLQLGLAHSNYNWESDWLKSAGSMWIELSGSCYEGVKLVAHSEVLSTGDRLGFEVDYRTRKFTITRGRGRKGGPMKRVHAFPLSTSATYYPVFAARAVGNRVTILS